MPHKYSEPTPDLIEGVLPALETSILAGASGAGKTTLLMQIIKCLQDGRDVFGHVAQKNLRIGYIAADRTWASYEKLASTVGVDLDKIRVKAIIDDSAIDVDQFENNPMKTLSTLVGQMLPLDLLVVDPLIVFLGIDANRYHLAASRLIKLNKWCRTNNVTILGTHHATKARTDYSFKRPQDRISGSSALLGFTSTQLFIASPLETGGEYTEWYIVSHHAPAETIELRRNETTGLFEVAEQKSGIAVLFDPDRQPKTYHLAVKLLEWMPKNGELVPRQLIVESFKEVGSTRLIDTILKGLVEVKVLHKTDDGEYVVIPDSRFAS